MFAQGIMMRLRESIAGISERYKKNSVHMLDLLTVGVYIIRGALLFVFQLFSFVKPWEPPEVHLHQPGIAT